MEEKRENPFQTPNALGLVFAKVKYVKAQACQNVLGIRIGYRYFF